MSSDSELAIAVRGLGKSYTIRHNAIAHTTLAESLMYRLRHPLSRAGASREQFWALQDVNFDIKRGEVVGIIGRNGAGKSTLLKLLSRITEPTTGEIDLFGRVGSLLEVGTGFHQELTGRENIFLNGAILGMTRAEIKTQFAAIVAFAGIEQFLDTPVKRYSSGMYVRLAFAVAAHLRSEILIVDEVLAVGDAEFQDKCLGKMRDVSADGRTVILVSHQMSTISNLCSAALLLAGGRAVGLQSVPEVIETYRKLMNADGEAEVTFADAKPQASYVRATLATADGRNATRFRFDEPIRISIELDVRDAISMAEPAIEFRAADRALVTVACPAFAGAVLETTFTRGRYEIVCDVPALSLQPGTYSVTLILHRPKIHLYDRRDDALQFEVTGDRRFESFAGVAIGSLLPTFVWRISDESGSPADD